MTIRNRSKLVPFTPNLTCKLDYADGSPYISQGSPASHNLAHDMTDELSPDYFSKRKRGEFLPINDMTQSYASITEQTSGTVKYKYYSSGTLLYLLEFSGPMALQGHVYHFGATFTPPYYGSNPTWPTEGIIVTEALANARTRGFDVLTWLAEFGKTVALIAQLRTRILKRAEVIAHSLRTKGAHKGIYALEAFGQEWLELRYGWRLLAFDAEEITEAIIKLNRTKPPFIRGYSSGSASSLKVYDYTTPSTYIRRYTPGYSPTAIYGGASFTIEQVKTREVRAGVVLDAIFDDLVEFNVLLTAWEVVPFSFIVDWFVNVGDTIAAFTPSVTENLLGAWTKQTETLVTTTTLVPSSLGNLTNGTILDGSTLPAYVFEVTNLNTTRTSATPSANLSFRLDLNAFKLVDLASIFLGGVGKIIREYLKP